MESNISLNCVFISFEYYSSILLSDLSVLWIIYSNYNKFMAQVYNNKKMKLINANNLYSLQQYFILFILFNRITRLSQKVSGPYIYTHTCVRYWSSRFVHVGFRPYQLIPLIPYIFRQRISQQNKFESFWTCINII